ncbi:MAG: anaerobic glycerol-3-phosphate dehydrogenase subunit B [Bacteroidales bacterium]|nr:anaerobic glycerol-3-phosphate dehydrogenase subunit B [Bacteroidales bacterium]
MKFDTVIIGGGLAGLVAGISLQKAGRSTAIVSAGQNALHFFSGTFESMEQDARTEDLFAEAGIRLSWREGWRLMPLGTFRPAGLSLEDVSLLETPSLPGSALIVNFAGFHDFFASFLAEGLEKAGTSCRTRVLQLQEMEDMRLSPSEMRSVNIARTMDRVWEKVVREVRELLKDEDTVILPQVFGLEDPAVPGKIRAALPARVVFVGTLPPSVPGIRTQHQLQRRYGVLGGTYLMGDEVVSARMEENRVLSVSTKNLGSHVLSADSFVLSSGAFFSKGLLSTPEHVYEPLFKLDVVFAGERSGWYRPDFMEDQPYLSFGVRTDADLRALKGGRPVENLYAMGSILGGTRPEFGTGGGLAIRSAFAVADALTRSAL